MYNKPLKYCCTEAIKPMYDDTKEYDFFGPIKKYSKEYNIKFDFSESKDKKLKQSKENDTVMNFYVKSSKDISFIFIYPQALKHNKIVDKVMGLLKENGSIYYEKDIEFDYKMAYNLVYQLYYNEYRMKTPSQINFKVSHVGFDFEDKKSKKIKVLVYKHKNHKEPINGNSSPFKQKLRQLFLDEELKTTKIDPQDDKYPRLYDYIHVNNDDNQAFDYAGIVLNKNSIKSLKKQQSWKTFEMMKSITLFNKMKNFLYKYSQKAIENFIIISSGVLFSHGIRQMNDVDGLLLPTTGIQPDDIDGFNIKDELDITYKGTKEYNDNWEQALNDRAKTYGAKDYKELIINPKFHYYFMGLKFIRLKYDLVTRFSRGRPAQITDLLILRQLYNLKYKLAVPKTRTEYDKDSKKDVTKDVDYDKFLSTVNWYLKKRYFINISLENTKDWIENYKLPVATAKKMKGGGNYVDNKDISDADVIYPSKKDLIKMGYMPTLSMYNDNRPYIYLVEAFKYHSVTNYCQAKPREARKPHGHTFSVMSFNVHNFVSKCNQGLNPMFAEKLNPYYKPRDLNRFIDLFKEHSPTVLCLQEVVPMINKPIDKDINDYDYIAKNFNFKYLCKRMAEIGYSHKVIANTTTNDRAFDAESDYYILANAIFSKEPINSYHIKQMSFANRNFVHANITIKGRNIDFINLHFEYFSNPARKVDIVTKQYELLEEYVKTINNNNIIICGDFNINLYNKGFGPRYKKYEEKTNFIQRNYKSLNYVKIYTNFTHNNTTDFILLNNRSRLYSKVNNIIRTNISDHYPIIAYVQ
jgi:endonuclease/exonuclease/phosphatase family metal-dependent hydrolase